MSQLLMYIAAQAGSDSVSDFFKYIFLNIYLHYI